MFGLGGFYDVLVVAGFLALQYFFATRRHFLWGAILPIVFIGWRIYMVSTNDSNLLVNGVITIVGLLFLLVEWKSGRDAVKKKIEKELNKMQSHDLK